MSRYLGLFVAEASEHLEALGRDLVSLEGTPTTETVDSLFRHAHSVKGMAASMGLEPIAQLAHRVEDLVEVARRVPGALGRERVDLLLSATDTMLALVRGTGEGNAPAQQPELLGKLSEAVVALTGQPPRPTKVARVDPLTPGQAAPLSARRFEIRFHILPAAQSPGPRAFLVYKKLTGLGTVSNLRPPLEDLRAGAIPDGRVALVLETDGGLEPVRTALGLVPEVELTSADPLVETPAAPPTPAPAPTEAARTVRVRTELLDDFLEMAGELLLATARLRDIGRHFPEHGRPVLEEGVDRLHSL
jgi:two-component system chemotaxis sensor kinase CheA